MYIDIHFNNGSSCAAPQFSYREAMRYARENIAYGGGRVRRVELVSGDSRRALWDAAWDAESNAAGLRTAP